MFFVYLAWENYAKIFEYPSGDLEFVTRIDKFLIYIYIEILLFYTHFFPALSFTGGPGD